VSAEAADAAERGIDDCADDSARGRLVHSLTRALEELIAEGDRDGARVALEALGGIVRLIPEEPARTEGASGERARDCGPGPRCELAPGRGGGEPERRAIASVTPIDRATRWSCPDLADRFDCLT
jgi:hypothetical protein